MECSKQCCPIISAIKLLFKLVLIYILFLAYQSYKQNTDAYVSWVNFCIKEKTANPKAKIESPSAAPGPMSAPPVKNPQITTY